MRVRELLTMNAGDQDELKLGASREALGESVFVASVPHKPGSQFPFTNTPATLHGFQAIVQQVTGGDGARLSHAAAV